MAEQSLTEAPVLFYEGTVAKRKEDADFDWPRIVELERFREYAKRNYAFDNVIAAQGAIKQIKENLTNLKSHLEVAHQPTSESFEL